jgi:hypothetical protein
MNYVILKNYDHYVIVNDAANVTVGRVNPVNGLHSPYRVSFDVGPMDSETFEAVVVDSLDDAIPVLLAHYERFPPQWELSNNAYLKFTMFVTLRVAEDQAGDWLAYRDDYPLLQKGKTARFVTCADAERAADVHELDLYPNAKTISDGFSWLPDPEIDWRSIPHLVEARAAWQRDASRLLP